MLTCHLSVGCLSYPKKRWVLKNHRGKCFSISYDVWRLFHIFGAHEYSDFDCQIEVILKFEEMCLESAREYSPLFVQVSCFVLRSCFSFAVNG